MMKKSKREERKLIQFGNDVYVRLSSEELKRFNLDATDHVIVSTSNEGIFIQPLSHNDLDGPSEFEKEINQIMNEHDETFKGLVDR